MITERMQMGINILEKYPHTRGDGNAEFLNAVYREYFDNKPIDFHEFVVETWTKVRRIAMNKNPHLDNRTKKSHELDAEVRNEHNKIMYGE